MMASRWATTNSYNINTVLGCVEGTEAGTCDDGSAELGPLYVSD
jgi:hypothetical protein